MGQSSNKQTVGVGICPLLSLCVGHLATWLRTQGIKAPYNCMSLFHGCRRRSVRALTLSEAVAVLELRTHLMKGSAQGDSSVHSASLVPDTHPGSGNAAVDKTHKNLCCPGVYILRGETGHAQYNQVNYNKECANENCYRKKESQEGDLKMLGDRCCHFRSAG